jgi:hypothetical protein
LTPNYYFNRQVRLTAPTSYLSLSLSLLLSGIFHILQLHCCCHCLAACVVALWCYCFVIGRSQCFYYLTIYIALNSSSSSSSVTGQTLLLLYGLALTIAFPAYSCCATALLAPDSEISTMFDDLESVIIGKCSIV